MYSKQRLPFDLWLGRGKPLNPDLNAIFIDHLRKQMRPTEISLIPDELLEQKGMADFLEWSSLRAWVKQWLKYCRWYYKEALYPEVNIEAFFDAPVITTKWYVTRTYPELVRFGFMWK